MPPRKRGAASIEYTVPGLVWVDAIKVVTLPQDRLNALNDLRAPVDTTAERIATLGGSPAGTAGAIVTQRTWDGYSIGRADAIEKTEELEPVTQDMLIARAAQLEQYQWFVRAHLENSGGRLATSVATTEKAAARRGRR